jgi:hypothetical protein
LTDYTAPAPIQRNVDVQLISGFVGSALAAKDVRVTLRDTALHSAIAEVAPVEWIVNLPEGLTAEVNPAAAGATVLVLTVSGTSLAPSAEAVHLNIPADVLTRSADLDIVSDNILFDIVGTVTGDVTIGGFTGYEITAKDLSLSLFGDTLRAAIAPGTTVPWITNLPQGLTARIKLATAGADSLTLTVSGTPQEERDAPITLSIPAGVLSRGIAFTAAVNQNARFSIAKAPQYRGASEQYQNIFSASGSSNPNWLGIQTGPLAAPQIPAIKDFEGVGIVRISAQATESLGADNQYHWSGESINYSKLMAEAQRLGGHAIINVVVDFEDRIEYVRTVKYIDETYEYSPDEASKIEMGIIVVREIEGVEYLEETTHVITRTYYGTALAIKYVTGTNYYEVEGLRAAE